MKKLLILMLVLGVASAANATLLISVDGQIDPPDTSITLLPSETVVLDIMGDGGPQPLDAFLVIQGPGEIAGYNMLYLGDLSIYMELEEFAAGAGMTPEDLLDALDTVYGYPGATDLSFMTFADSPGGDYPTLDGKLVDDIIFHCTGEGDVTLTLTDSAFSEVFNSVVIHNIPEPMTIALLGLGGLFLRRRR